MTCRCCRRPRSAADPYVGSMVFPETYLVLRNCACGSTYGLVMWESEDSALENAAEEKDAA